MHPVPPLNALRAFEATARHLSLTRAADELSVSPGAISHQIRGLEALLGMQLFERRVRAIALTPCGPAPVPASADGLSAHSTGARGAQRCWHRSRPGGQLVSRPHVKMAGAAPLPLCRRPSGH